MAKSAVSQAASPAEVLKALRQLNPQQLDARIGELEAELDTLKFLRRTSQVARGERPARKKPEKKTPAAPSGGKGGGEAKPSAPPASAATDDADRLVAIRDYLKVAGRARKQIIAADTGIHHFTVDRLLRDPANGFHLQPEGYWVIKKAKEE